MLAKMKDFKGFSFKIGIKDTKFKTVLIHKTGDIPSMKG